MYRTQTEKTARDIWLWTAYGIVFLGIFILSGPILAFAIKFATSDYLDLGLAGTMILSLVATGVAIGGSFNYITIEVTKNSIAMLVDVIFPRVNSDQDTLHIEIPTGLHPKLPWWFLPPGNVVDISKEPPIPISLTASALDDDMTVDAIVNTKADPKNLDAFISRGDSDEDRMENIRKNIQTVIKRLIESVISQMSAEAVLASRDTIEIEVLSLFESVRPELELRLGIDVRSIHIGSIDASEDYSEARRSKGVNERLTAQAKQIVIESGGKVSFADALAHVRVISDEATETQYRVRGLEGLQNATLLGALGGQDSKKKTAKKKGGNRP